MTSAFSWQNSVSLCPASFCTPRPNLPVTPGISWLPTVHSIPLWWKGHLFGVLVLEGVVGLHRTIQLQLLRHYWSGHRLGLLWYWMVCLGNKQRSFCHFWVCIQALLFGLFCLPWCLPHFPNTAQLQVLCSTWMQSQKWQNDLCSFPRQIIQYHGNPSLCPNQ